MRVMQVATALVVAWALAGYGLDAGAQSPPPSPAEGGSSGSITDRTKADESKEERTRTVIETVRDAPLSQGGGDVDSRLKELMQEEGDWIGKVQMIGRARSTNSAQGKLGQVVWYGLKAEVEDKDTGEKRVKKAGVRKPLKSSFIANSDTLPEEAELQATGDVDSLVEDARRLLSQIEEDGKAADEEDAGGDEEAEGQEEEKKRSGGGGPTLPGQQGGNDEARFDQLDVNEPESAPSPSRATMESTEGCKPRVDLDNRVVIPTSKMITIEEGQIVEESECSDTSQSYPIQWSYQACSDAVDLEARRAFPQAQPFYVDDFGSPSYVGECQRVDDEAFAIVEDFDACSPRIDMESLKAIRRFELVYENRNGVRTVVKGCQDAEGDGAAFEIKETAEGCGFRHDMDAELSNQQTRYVYMHDKSEKVVQPCADSDKEYAHQLDFTVCQPLVDQDAGMVTPRARRLITVDDGYDVIIAECAPVPDQAQELVATFAGCESSFVHNIEAGQSLRTERWYHTLSTNRTYVTGCEASRAPALEHQYETVGWQNDDDALQAFPIERTFIEAPTVGEVEVASGRVRDGVPAVPYEYQGDGEEPRESEVYYEGCDAYTPTNAVKNYRRPDTTMMAVVVGEGSVQGPRAACTGTVEQRQVYKHTRKSGGEGGVCRGGGTCYYGNADKRFGSGTKTFGGGPYKKCYAQAPMGGSSNMSFSNYDDRQQRTVQTREDGEVFEGSWSSIGSVKTSGGSCSDSDDRDIGGR